MEGKLYLIATPIGNLGDITYRAVEILKDVDIIAAEDTRHTLKLLNYLEISKPMISYHRHNEDVKSVELIRLLKEGKSQKEVLEVLKNMQMQNKTIIFCEAPHRILKTLVELNKIFGNINIVLAKEITKIHEEFIRNNIEQIIKDFSEKEIKGEYIILFENHSKTKKELEIEKINKLDLEEQYNYFEKEGLNKKEIIKKIAKNNNVPKDEIYKKFLNK